MRRALGPGRAVLMFGPATWVRVLVVMMFLLRKACGTPRRECRSFCQPATAIWLDWDDAGGRRKDRKLASRRRKGWDGPYRAPAWTRLHAHLRRTPDWRRRQRRSAGSSGWSSGTPKLIIVAFPARSKPPKKGALRT